MGLITAIGVVWAAGRDVEEVYKIAVEKISEGKGPVAVLRAMVEVSDNKIDDHTFTELENVVKKSLIVSQKVISVIAKVVKHEDSIQKFIDKSFKVTINAGYQAGRWNNKLLAWLKE